MHMADALLSPEVGGTIWAASAATIGYASSRVRKNLDDRKIPLMGVLAAFVFAAQMINFTIPGTGSSGHLGGGLLLAILIGPHAAVIAIASILTVQALFFGDGGLLALGCNIFNMGILSCYLAYPLVYKKVVGTHPTPGRLVAGGLAAGIVGLQLGALGVVLETTMSRISELPFLSFLIMMQPVHFAIGIVEGLVTAGIVAFIWNARPEILDLSAHELPMGKLPIKKVVSGLAAATLLTGGLLSWFASEHPDGLEWSLQKITGREELASPPDRVHSSLAWIQETTAFMPDYGFKNEETDERETASSSSPDLATSVAGLTGGLLVLLLGLVLGFSLKKKTGSRHSRP